MPFPRFDPTHTVKFDIGHGTVQLQGAGPRLLVPPEALLDLCKHAGDESLRDFGRKLGTEAGRRLASELGDAVKTAGVEGFVEHLAGNLALLGLGALSLERWGKAAVFVIDHSPLGAAGDTLLAAIIEGALQRALGRDVDAVVLGRDDGTVRLLAAGHVGAGKVRQWLASGVAWGEALSRLHEGGAA
jgi:hypothetical protein